MYGIIIRCISATMHVILKVVSCFQCFKGQGFSPPTSICVTFADDLEIQVQVLLHLTCIFQLWHVHIVAEVGKLICKFMVTRQGS